MTATTAFKFSRIVELCPVISMQLNTLTHLNSINQFSWYLLGVEVLCCRAHLCKTVVSFKGVYENFR